MKHAGVCGIGAALCRLHVSKGAVALKQGVGGEPNGVAVDR